MVFRIHPDERAANPQDEYFVTKTVERAKNLDARGVCATPFFNYGWIVKIRWYHPKSVEENERGYEQYLDVSWTVRNLTRTKLSSRESGGLYMYKVSRYLDQYIIQYGALTI